MFAWWTRRRRRKLLATPVPDAWREWIAGHVAHWHYLDEDERSELLDLVRVFVAEKDWEGCGGLVIDDEIRVTIAAFACLLLLGIEHDYYRNVQSILVYPSTVVAPGGVTAVSDRIVAERAPVPIAGQAMLRGPVLLVWDDVRRDAAHPERGHNVVYHEFAHKLDMLDGQADGTPPMADRARYDRWVTVCTQEFDRLRRRSERAKPTFLDPYGATNVAEFFAVATEHFFDRPRAMRRRRPDLYGVLREFYGQDPAAREEQ